MAKSIILPEDRDEQALSGPSFRIADNPLNHPCKGCFHWRGASFGSNCCNYIFDVGHRRPCTGGEGCKVRQERGQAELEKLREMQKPK